MVGEMKLVQSGNKWVLYNSNGKVVIITTTKRIAERMMQNESVPTNSTSV
jgi:hypothetical protein